MSDMFKIDFLKSLFCELDNKWRDLFDESLVGICGGSSLRSFLPELGLVDFSSTQECPTLLFELLLGRLGLLGVFPFFFWLDCSLPELSLEFELLLAFFLLGLENFISSIEFHEVEVILEAPANFELLVVSSNRSDCIALSTISFWIGLVTCFSIVLAISILLGFNNDVGLEGVGEVDLVTTVIVFIGISLGEEMVSEVLPLDDL